MNAHKKDVLATVAEALTERGVSFGVGGSTLLSFHHVVDVVNDLDLILSESHVETVQHCLKALGKEMPVTHKEPFRTRFFSSYCIENVQIDVMAGFAIAHENGLYEFSFDRSSIANKKGVSQKKIPFMYLEDWYVFYLLMPNRKGKIRQLENYFRNKGVRHPEKLRVALQQPLPIAVREKVTDVLNA